MNAWRGHIGMTGNKLYAASLVLFLGLTAVPACAQTSMMGLAYVEEIVIQTPRFGNAADSRKCELSENDIMGFVLNKLKAEGLPAYSLLDSPPPNEKKARIFIVPEVTTMEVRGVACVSSVTLTAKSPATLSLPPIPVPRSVTITYWSAGLMVNSSRAGHPQVIEGGLEKLAEFFGREYRLAQPPVIKLDNDNPK